ncbi:GNAT family N-acetyltransferase [Oceanisphaera avium]|uniref:GNAT family N-acetyltransferase n=1 Tax=Oceanisphaera avium TaxID=1903694 RepID=A0A1Y0CVI1_9GAMM|nr:GNAT family N-acetyltransferase [Oceanisphaera avium]ART78907.1 GNAT family N-acetyltransferase [Oceanisphaera avium]
MIRAARPTDEQAIHDIWLLASLQAHDFIPAAFWWQQQEALRARYLPEAEIWLWDQAGDIQGFVALLDDYVAALFVRPDCQQQGIGRQLLNNVKNKRRQLLMRVYCENDIAMNFYLSQGFTVVKEEIDTASGQPILFLRYLPANSH